MTRKKPSKDLGKCLFSEKGKAHVWPQDASPHGCWVCACVFCFPCSWFPNLFGSNSFLPLLYCIYFALLVSDPLWNEARQSKELNGLARYSSSPEV